MNIKLSYLYRDYSNYKNFGEVVFANPEGLELNVIGSSIKSYLIDGTWFNTSESQLPDLHFDNWDAEDDHFFHEFEGIEETNKPPNSAMTINGFLEIVRKARRKFV